MGKRGEKQFQVWARSALALAAALAATWLTGCAGFFDAPTSTTTSTTSNSGDYVYVVNNATNTLGAFGLGTGALVAITTSAYALPTGLAAASVVVSRPNTFVFVGGLGAIECYTIGTGGVLTQATSGGATELADFVSMATSPDGQWLLALDSENDYIYVFGINTSTGLLTLNQKVALAGNVPGSQTLSLSTPPTSIRIAPAGTFVAASLGPSGDAFYTFVTSTGMLTYTGGVVTPAGFTDNAVQFDASSSYLFVARGVTGATGTSSVNSFSFTAAGVLTAVQTIASGNSPHALELDSTGAYLYAANSGDGTISGYNFSAGTLTALKTSPYTSGTTVRALVRDNSNRYILAASLGGSNDVTMYALDAGTGGQLDDVSAQASGSDPAGSIAIAATH